MIAELPDFDIDLDFRQQSPEEAKRKWRFITIRRNELVLSSDTGVHAAFLDGNGIERARIEGRKIISHSGYAWNGCTPKRWVPFLGWIGTPDHPLNVQASHWHDLLCQFFTTEHFPLHRYQVDEIFLAIMLRRGFRWANLYHGAVEDFGPLFKAPGDGSYSVLLT